MKAIETKLLTKYYGSSRGIIDVDLTVEKGDFFGFIGPNGAGKSTAIRTMLGFISATCGTAKVFGKDIVECRTEILSETGYLPSETFFYNGMKVKDIIALSAKLRKKDCEKEAKRICGILDLDTEKKIEELSLGNRKKVGIVCALQHRPELYILDEPTSGLDPLMQKAFYSLLEERNREGATVFLSSHILSEVQRHCKNAAVIRDGRIIVSDSIVNIGNKDVKRVTLRGVAEKPAITNARDIKTENDVISFLYGGTPQELLRMLSELSFEDFTVAEPDLEEVFLHFYAKE